MAYRALNEANRANTRIDSHEVNCEERYQILYGAVKWIIAILVAGQGGVIALLAAKFIH